MKKILLSIIALATIVSCELDNFDGPDAQIYGAVKDAETGELIQQDIKSGSKIIFEELGFENPEQQRMRFKSNGEYRNNLIFSGHYDFYFEETNFQIPERIKDYKIKKGENRLDFNVIPFIRISDSKIEKVGDKVIATFKITPTVDAKVRKVELFGHPDSFVSESFADLRVSQDVNQSFKGETKSYSLELSTNDIKKGRSFCFRIGAIVELPNAKHNYSESIRFNF